MSQVTPRGFKLKYIVDKLAFDLLSILSETLTEPSLNPDRLGLRILLTLSQRHYVNELLFRDFDLDQENTWWLWKVPPKLLNGKKEVRIHKESLVYLESVLMRRLTLANNLKESPSTMHQLFKGLCQYSRPRQVWQTVELQRDPQRAPTNNNQPFFQQVAKHLALACQRLNSHCSEIAQRRRAQYGPFWLCLEKCAAEVPEELALFFDVLDILLLPLESDFAQDRDVQRVFDRVLKSLNERYQLLRSCGLRPETWMEREEPSIQVLREMRTLRKCAQKKWTEKHASLEEAYQEAFEFFQKEKDKFAGSRDFKEFTASEWGKTMLRVSLTSLNHPIDEDECLQDFLIAPDETYEYARPEGSEYNEENDKNSAWAQYRVREARYQLVEAYPKHFCHDQVLIYFFCEILGFNHSLTDPKFKQLVETNPAYAQFSDSELFAVLGEKLEKIIEQCIQDVKKRCKSKRRSL